jgi:hypothetical protein
MIFGSRRRSTHGHNDLNKVSAATQRFSNLLFILIPLLLLFASLLAIAAATFNDYYIYYPFVRTGVIVAPILTAFMAVLFFSEKPFSNYHEWFMGLISEKFSGARVVLWCCCWLFLFTDLSLIWALVSSRTVHVRASATSEMFLVRAGVTRLRLGIVPKDFDIAFRVPSGIEELEFVSDGRTTLTKIPKSASTVVSVNSEPIPTEHLNLAGTSGSNTTSPANASTTNGEVLRRHKAVDYRALFSAMNKAQTESPIHIERFEIAHDYSIYAEMPRENGLRFEISGRLTHSEDRELGSSDYLKFIGITDKIAHLTSLTEDERLFMSRAKPVFNVTIYNGTGHQILLRKIIVTVRSVEVVFGGGSKILTPEVQYEFEVPRQPGSYVFPVANRPLVIDAGSFGECSLSLLSTNKKVLDNGAVVYPQLNYDLSLDFDFGLAHAIEPHISVLF